MKFITLTVPNLDSLDGEVFKRIRAGFGKLRRRNFLKDRLKGGVYVIETTNEGRGWNIHIHVLADCDYLDQPELAREWKKCLLLDWQRRIEEAQPEGRKDRAVVYIQAGRQAQKAMSDYLAKGLTGEISKYLAKGSNFIDQPELVSEYYDAAKNRRLFETFGSCRGRFRDLVREQKEKKSEDEFKCPHGFDLDFAGTLDHCSLREVFEGFAYLEDRSYSFVRNNWTNRQFESGRYG